MTLRGMLVLLQCAWNDRLEAVKGVVQPDMFVFVARLHQSICLLVWCMIMRQICAHRHKIEVHVSHWSGAWPERPLSKQRQEPAHDKEKEQEYTLEEWSISQDAATTGTNNMLCIRFRKCTDNILPFAAHEHIFLARTTLRTIHPMHLYWLNVFERFFMSLQNHPIRAPCEFWVFLSSLRSLLS